MTTTKEEIPCCENCDNFQERDNVQMGEWITVHTCMGEIIPESQSMCTRVRGCLKHPGARAYLNKDVIAELESWINGLEYPDCPPGDAYARVIALLKECGQE